MVTVLLFQLNMMVCLSPIGLHNHPNPCSGIVIKFQSSFSQIIVLKMYLYSFPNKAEGRTLTSHHRFIQSNWLPMQSPSMGHTPLTCFTPIGPYRIIRVWPCSYTKQDKFFGASTCRIKEPEDRTCSGAASL